MNTCKKAETVLDTIIWVMRQKDSQDPIINLIELFRSVGRLQQVAEDEALREPIIKELMGNPMVKTFFKMGFEGAMGTQPNGMT